MTTSNLFSVYEENNLTDKDIAKSLYVSDWGFDIYKVKNNSYGNGDNRKYIFFAAGYHSKEGFTTKRLPIRNLRSINIIKNVIRSNFELWDN